MRRLMHMVEKDLKRDLREPMAILIYLAFPLLFAALLGVTFGGSGTTFPKVELLIEDQDGGLVAQLLRSAFTAETAEFFTVETVTEGGQERIEAGEASALLRIPEGFSEDFFKGNATALQLVRNPQQQILPEVAEQLTLVVSEVLSSASRVLREPLNETTSWFEETSATPTSAQVAAASTMFYDAVGRSEQYVLPPVISLEVVDLGASEEGEESAKPAGGPSIFLFMLPGISVFALFMIGDHGMRDLLVELEAGTLRRQLSGPLGAGTVVAGKVLHTAVLAGLCLLVLSSVAAIVMEQAVDIPAFLLLAVGLVLVVTGISTLIYGVSRDQQQGSTIGSAAYLFMGFAGGSFFPADSLPGILQTVAPYTPLYWANEGFRALIGDAAGLADLVPQIGLLMVTGVVALMIGSRRLERKLAQ